MASNITFDEAVAKLTAMQEQLRISDLPAEATEIKVDNGIIGGGGLSMDQNEAKKCPVDFLDLGSALSKQMKETIATKVDAYECHAKKVQDLLLTGKTPFGPVETAAEIAVIQEEIEQFELSYMKKHINRLNMVMAALQEVRNTIHHFKDSAGSGEDGAVVLSQLCYALEHFFGCKTKMAKSWEKLEVFRELTLQCLDREK